MKQKEENKIDKMSIALLVMSIMILVFILFAVITFIVNYEEARHKNKIEELQLQKEILLLKNISEINNTNYEAELKVKESAIEEYKLIMKNMHDNYNNQDYRFDKMLNYTLNAREELFQCNDYLFKLDYILRTKYDWNGEIQ